MTDFGRTPSSSDDFNSALSRRRRLISLLAGGQSTEIAGRQSDTTKPLSSCVNTQASQDPSQPVNDLRETTREPGAQESMTTDSDTGLAAGAGPTNPLMPPTQQAEAVGDVEDSGAKYPPLPMSAPSTPDMNSKITQAVQFTNFENYQGLETMISVPEDVLISQSTGHASQNAEGYMNGVMQISMAAQAIVAAKIAQAPAKAAADAVALEKLNEMVTNAIAAFQDVSK